MRINKLIGNIQNRILDGKIRRKEAAIGKYFKIGSEERIPEAAYNRIFAAREVIANFAKQNSVEVKIYTSRESPEELLLFVKNLSNKMMEAASIPADVSKTYPKVSEGIVMVPAHPDGTKVARKTTHYTEDTFLRNLYRNIETMTGIIKKSEF